MSMELSGQDAFEAVMDRLAKAIEERKAAEDQVGFSDGMVRELRAQALRDESATKSDRKRLTATIERLVRAMPASPLTAELVADACIVAGLDAPIPF